MTEFEWPASSSLSPPSPPPLPPLSPPSLGFSSSTPREHSAARVSSPQVFHLVYTWSSAATRRIATRQSGNDDVRRTPTSPSTQPVTVVSSSGERT
ncbi:hypothetical protein E2C01_013893 [Portunus trituberculatus]|uniref:Uncharacterized protein n=1 Tax=Portunus trituberculatus TaxID=210409 RepID=A0A5B7DIP7_PORTR|nr:hypothetical protein [Portunus trituberculatus]